MSKRVWWTGLIGIVIIAAIFRFLNFQLALPFYYDSDEPWFFYEAAWQRGLIPSWLHPNPSQSLIALYHVAQTITDQLTYGDVIQHIPEVFTAMRFISVVLSLATIVFIGLCARELADERAGWIAAAGWALIPLVIYHSFIAIAEPWMMLCMSIALYSAVAALKRSQSRWAYISVAAGLVGFTFKYSMFPFAGIGLAAALWKIWTEPTQRWTWVRVVLLQIVGVAAFLAFMILFGGLLSDIGGGQREVASFFNEPLARFNDLSSLAEILGAAFFQFGVAPLVFIFTYVAAFVLIIRDHHSIYATLTDWRTAAWGLFLALGTFTMLLVPTYLLYWGALGRYMFGASMIFLIIGAASFSHLVNRLHQSIDLQGRQGLLRAGTVLVVALWIISLFTASAEQAVRFSRPYTLTDLMTWASNSMGEGDVVTDPLASRAFSREWGGYQGAKRLIDYGTPLMTQSPEQWRRAGYNYLEIIEEDMQRIVATSEGSRYFSQLLELRRFPPPESAETWTGASFIMYFLQRPETDSDIVFGETLRLIGYDGIHESVTAGDTMSLRFYWQALQPP